MHLTTNNKSWDLFSAYPLLLCVWIHSWFLLLIVIIILSFTIFKRKGKLIRIHIRFVVWPFAVGFWHPHIAFVLYSQSSSCSIKEIWQIDVFIWYIHLTVVLTFVGLQSSNDYILRTNCNVSGSWIKSYDLLRTCFLKNV